MGVRSLEFGGAFILTPLAGNGLGVRSVLNSTANGVGVARRRHRTS
ncbi:hypothetical protein COO91_07402 [Nostoc flagelliforme CCNUN1]|uniref:Uncharacterized protein n=1 Tax=Nostoc flagelliforme CCNUN1 TaxID=2038116 RepID=A0A2K8T0X7_9NOSO|nr:hypothetical protein COO91_07402 [Nostoc flagelliforme CCNUN1]